MSSPSRHPCTIDPHGGSGIPREVRPVGPNMCRETDVVEAVGNDAGGKIAAISGATSSMRSGNLAPGRPTPVTLRTY